MHSLKLAGEEDWAEVLRMGLAFHEVSPYRDYPFNEQKVRAIFDKYLICPEEVIIILGCQEGKVVACLVATIAELYFSTFRSAGEVIWWVDQEYRKSVIGLKLHQAFEFWANKMRVDIIQCVQTEATTDLVKFYNRHGYHLAESVYIKEIKDARI